MTPTKRINSWKLQENMRSYFAFEIYKAMATNKNIYLLTGDLGFGLFDNHKEDFPERFINCGAAEQAMIGIAVGLALEGKIPFVYSITNFLLYRPFETIRNYINHEKIPVNLIGSGRNRDYEHDGISHWSEDAAVLFSMLPHITPYFPDKNSDVIKIVNRMIYSHKPAFLSLRR